MTDLSSRVEAALGTGVQRTYALGTGSSGSGAVLTRLSLSDGREVVAKSAEGAFSGLTLEAWMLQTLAGHGFPVPDVHHAEDRLLIMQKMSAVI